MFQRDGFTRDGTPDEIHGITKDVTEGRSIGKIECAKEFLEALESEGSNKKQKLSVDVKQHGTKVITTQSQSRGSVGRKRNARENPHCNKKSKTIVGQKYLEFGSVDRQLQQQQELAELESKTPIAVGSVGYKFQKQFPDGKWYTGVVVQVRSSKGTPQGLLQMNLLLLLTLYSYLLRSKFTRKTAGATIPKTTISRT